MRVCLFVCILCIDDDDDVCVCVVHECITCVYACLCVVCVCCVPVLYAFVVCVFCMRVFFACVVCMCICACFYIYILVYVRPCTHRNIYSLQLMYTRISFNGYRFHTDCLQAKKLMLISRLSILENQITLCLVLSSSAYSF